jgi:hypothetical protein
MVNNEEAANQDKSQSGVKRGWRLYIQQDKREGAVRGFRKTLRYLGMKVVWILSVRLTDRKGQTLKW